MSQQRWTAEQDAILISAVAQSSSENPEINWQHVANHLPNRTNKHCRKRWHYNVAREFRKGPWSNDEDQRLREAVRKHGTKWKMVYSVMGTRNGDQCWKRWNDHLDPSINHGPWDSHEDSLLFAAVESMGRSWSEIVGTYLPGRTALGAKNRFTLLNRRPEVDNTAPGTSQSVASSSLSASSIQSPEYEEFDFLSLGIESATADFVLNHMDTANLDPEILQSCSMNSPLAQVTDQNLEDLSSEHPLSKIDPTISNYPELSDSALIQDDQGGCSAPPIEHSGTESTSSQGDSPSSVMKELTIKLKCRSGRTETIMGGLTALMNNLMVKGDVKDVSISIS